MVFGTMGRSSMRMRAWRIPGDIRRAEDRPQTLWVSSASGALYGALVLYARNFHHFLVTFWLPLLPLDLYVAFKGETWWTWVLWFFLGCIGFSALALTVSDVCNGIRPAIRRSYRRLTGKRLLYVMTNALILALIVAGPPLAAFSMAMLLSEVFITVLAGLVGLSSIVTAVFMIFVPVVTALEEDITPSDVMQRSFSLGIGYVGRTLLALILVVFFGGALVLIVSWATGTWPHENLAARLFVSRLLMPWVFAAAVLMYYDLRTRKEGYNFRALVEDLWMN